uniref:Uncharacterized protein n=1 Tax=Ciona intestinalis TaxID=7719 RepID=H2XLG4_CIOIN
MSQCSSRLISPTLVVSRTYPFFFTNSYLTSSSSLATVTCSTSGALAVEVNEADTCPVERFDMLNLSIFAFGAVAFSLSISSPLYSL